MPKVMLQGYRCERCEHEWLPRSTTGGEPTICPRCKSPYWNRPRKSAVTQIKVIESKIRELKARS